MVDKVSNSFTPRERLVQVVIDQIEQHGLARVTVRGIAAAAGMNIASVNYYFRSKEALLAEALESSVRHLVDDSEVFLARVAEDPHGVLTELFVYYFEGALRYPRMTRALLHGVFNGDDDSGPFPPLFIPIVERLRDAVKAAVPGLGAAEASRRVIVALSAVFFPGIFAQLYAPLGVLDTPQQRAVYAHELVVRMLAAAENPNVHPSRSPQPD